MNPVCPLLNEVCLLSSDMSQFCLVKEVLLDAIKSCVHLLWHFLL